MSEHEWSRSDAPGVRRSARQGRRDDDDTQQPIASSGTAVRTSCPSEEDPRQLGCASSGGFATCDHPSNHHYRTAHDRTHHEREQASLGTEYDSAARGATTTPDMAGRRRGRHGIAREGSLRSVS